MTLKEFLCTIKGYASIKLLNDANGEPLSDGEASIIDLYQFENEKVAEARFEVFDEAKGNRFIKVFITLHLATPNAEKSNQ